MPEKIPESEKPKVSSGLEGIPSENPTTGTAAALSQLMTKPEGAVIEKLATPEDVIAKMAEFMEGRVYRETGRKVDSNGKLISLETTMDLGNGETGCLNFEAIVFDAKKPDVPREGFGGSIFYTEFDSDGMPTGGRCLSNYKRDGTWVASPQRK